MTLHKDGLIVMEYDVATDTLVAKWIASKTSNSLELGYTMKLLVDKVRSYDIKKLLLDAREDVVGITDEEYVEINVKFAHNLATTRLVRVARLGTTNINRENFVKSLVEDVQSSTQTSLIYKEFNNEATALEWLQDNSAQHG
ncbi:hypothetical protein WG947_03660 [Pontibacter sp. H259]|uniref:hypothetical protein n=1 Tax=Pontibacter sp. H259 TaxID=3133421 RepID=UPI0030BE8B8E